MSLKQNPNPLNLVGKTTRVEYLKSRDNNLDTFLRSKYAVSEEAKEFESYLKSEVVRDAVTDLEKNASNEKLFKILEKQKGNLTVAQVFALQILLDRVGYSFDTVDGVYSEKSQKDFRFSGENVASSWYLSSATQKSVSFFAQNWNRAHYDEIESGKIKPLKENGQFNSEIFEALKAIIQHLDKKFTTETIQKAAEENKIDSEIDPNDREGIIDTIMELAKKQRRNSKGKRGDKYFDRGYLGRLPDEKLWKELGDIHKEVIKLQSARWKEDRFREAARKRWEKRKEQKEE